MEKDQEGEEGNMTETGIAILTLWAAIIQIESGGDPNIKDGAAGEVGIAQISEICLDDTNRICMILGLQERFTLEDRKNPEKAFKIFRIYTGFYGLRYTLLNDLDAVSVEILARIWNGGPFMEGTDDYWIKVEVALQEMVEDTEEEEDED